MVDHTLGARTADRVGAVGGTSPADTSSGEPAIETPTDLSRLYVAFKDADDQGDAQALARLGWVLFAMVSTAEHGHREMAGLLGELRSAARAAVSGGGSPASMAILRHALTGHGWLPPPDATPMQMLAAPSSR